jgi:hypothetical protein
MLCHLFFGEMRERVTVTQGVTLPTKHGSQAWTLDLDSSIDILHATLIMEHEVDGWIQQLTQCKQLTEADVKKLCDKVCRLFLYCR